LSVMSARSPAWHELHLQWRGVAISLFSSSFAYRRVVG
jgi:hypothetical protein